MKTTHIIATIAAAFLLFSAAPDASAQRGGGRSNNSSGEYRGSRSGGQQGHQQGGQRPQAAPSSGSSRPQQSDPRPSGSSSVNGRPMGHGGNPVRNAQGGHTHHHAPAPQPHHHHAPAPQPHHHAPAPHAHHHAPAHHHHAPAPRHYAAPARPFCARHYGPKPVYHHHIDSRARVFYIDEVPYYTYGGVYYQYVPSYGYQQIYMPENVIVTDLPYGASRVYVNSIGYYQADGMWFQPVDGGYLLVEKPVATVTVAVPRPTVSFHASFGF